MIDREAIAPAVVQILGDNMGLKRGERVLVVNDVPAVTDWRRMPLALLADMSTRSMLARIVADIGREAFPGCVVDLLTYACTGRNGQEPPAEVAGAMRSADVVLAVTTFSLSHTDAREIATRSGKRLASMPSIEPGMLLPGGPVSAGVEAIRSGSELFASALTRGSAVLLTTPAGTRLQMSLEGRKGEADTGALNHPGAWGNLPAGEAFIAPLEGTANGRVVIEKGWHPGLREDMAISFRDGLVVAIEGGGRIGDEFRGLLDLDADSPALMGRRNLAELGIGTNPNARRPDNVLEAEKIKGTVHVAIGDNSHMGGKVTAGMHEDFVLRDPTLYIDGRPVIEDGAWLI
ncbi:MAG: hypothetical protein HPY55_01620 [Firmicutes bacterium]|nr:hypothetical protein [Bacillota bacterium]